MKALLLVAILLSFTTTSYSSNRPIRVQFQVPPRQDGLHHSNRISDEASLKDLMRAFDRTGVESRPHSHSQAVSFRRTFLDEVRAVIDNRVPLRDAVEKIPIEGTMRILRYAAEEKEPVPFSRAHVEAFPEISDADAPKVVPYRATSESQNEFSFETRDATSALYQLSGFRGDVEAGHRTPNLDPFAAIRKSLTRNHITPSNLGSFNDVGENLTPFLKQSFGQPEGKVICYVGSWAVYRNRPMNFDADSVDTKACTHVIYSYAKMDAKTYEVVPLNQDQDVVAGRYKSMTSLKRKNPNIEILLRIGGWDEGRGYKYSQMASAKETRTTFVNSVIKALDTYDFDGIDLNWNYPGSPDYGGGFLDKANLNLLMHELKMAFAPTGRVLALSIPVVKTRITNGYDLAALSNDVDLFLIKSYDMRGAWDGITAHHAPLSSRPSEPQILADVNIESTISHMILNGATKEKIILGIPFYARTYTLLNPTKAAIGDKSFTVGREFLYTKAKGLAAFYEICRAQRNSGWMIERDPYGGSYMSKGLLWAGFDDEKDVKKKVYYAMKKGLGGVAPYSLDLDDFVGICGSKNPLLSAITSAMRDSQHFVPDPSTYSIDLIANNELPIQDLASSAMSASFSPEDNLRSPVATFSCANKAPGFYREARDCSVFYECRPSASETRLLSCPAGLTFDLKLGACVDFSSTACIPGFSSFGASKSVLTCQEDGMHNDPNDCRNYIWCKNGRSTVMSCPEGLFYNAESGICASLRSAYCASRAMVKPKPQIAQTIRSPIDDGAVPTLRRGRDKVIMCYYLSWSRYRPTPGKFVPENIDPNLCTHIVYIAATLDPKHLVIRSFDPFTDLEHDHYNRIKNLRNSNPDLKVLLSLGGFTDSTGDKYSRLVSDPRSRKKFIRTTLEIMKLHDFDGLDFHWEYPVCWQGDCFAGPVSDEMNFANLISELRMAFDMNSRPLTLVASISPAPGIIKRAYDIPSLTKNVDFLSVMTYSLHGHWDKRTGHNSPLYRYASSKEGSDIDSVIRYLISLGAERNKLLLGIPGFGQTHTLLSPGHTSVGDPTVGPGKRGPTTLQKGMLSYSEICQKERTLDYQKAYDPTNAKAPFAYSKTEWISYDDFDSVKEKAQYALREDLAGVMFWSIDFDDFQNLCCRESFPLLKTINRVFKGRFGLKPKPGGDCTRPPPAVTPAPPIPTTTYAGSAPEKPSTEYGDLLASTTPSTMEPVTTPSTPSSTTSTWVWTTPSTTTQKSTSWIPWWLQSSTPSSTSSTTSSWWTSTSESSTSSSTSGWPWWSSTASIPTTTSSSTTTDDEQPISSGIPHPGSPCDVAIYAPHPTSCKHFLICNSGVYQALRCAPPLEWDKTNSRCARKNVAMCSIGDTTQMTTERTTAFWQTTRSTTTTTQRTTPWHVVTTQGTTSTSTPKVILSESCISNEIRAKRDGCDGYLQCLGGSWIEMACAPGLLFSRKNKLCDWPYRTECFLSVRDPSPSPSDELPEVVTNIQPSHHVGLTEGANCDTFRGISHPNSCSSYFICVNNKYMMNSCPNGLFYDASIDGCNWPYNVKCFATSGIKPPVVPEIVAPKPTLPETPERPEPSVVPGVGTAIERPKPVHLKPVKPATGSHSGDHIIVCYFTNWAWYRPGLGKYKPSDIDSSLCTHVLYGFAVLDYSRLVIRTHDSWADIDNKFYTQVTALKAKGIKVLLALGGWNDSLGDKYSRLVHDANARAKFTTHAIEFLKKYNFDGLDLDWEYPVCWQVNCNKGPSTDKEMFTKWVQELHDAFKPHGYLLTAAVSPNPKVVDAGYDVPAISRYLDWIAVMTYDYYGSWDKRTGHHAPMYSHPDLNQKCFNVDCSIKHWLNRGAPKNKIVMGMPMYGRAFALDDNTRDGLNTSARQKGQAGTYTREAGFLAYYEVCHKIQQGWNIVHDNLNRMGPYAIGGRQWVGYDDVNTIRMKSEYIRKVGLRGGMIWALDLDDFGNRCGQGRHPLLTTINSVLRPKKGTFSYDASGFPRIPGESSGAGEQPESPGKPGEDPQKPSVDPAHLPGVVTPEEKPDPPPLIRPAESKDGYKVVCYFTNWSWYRPGEGKFLPEDIDPSLCTHIIYGFAVLDENSLLMKPHDTWTDLNNNFYSRLVEYKKLGIKVLLAIGGWNDSGNRKYSDMVNSPAARAAFNRHALNFIQMYKFDGLDLDWEYPKCWQVACDKGPASDKQAFTMWVKELKELFAPHGLLLSAAVSPNHKVMDEGYDIPMLSRYLDFINVMTYDYHGQWDKQTGHVAPLFDYKESPNSKFNLNYTMHYWVEKGADKKKLIVGMPSYGQSFTLADVTTGTGLNQKTYGGGEAGPFTRARGFLAYYEICHFIKHGNWKIERKHYRYMGPYATKGNQWVSFDDVSKIWEKSLYVKHMDFGGAMVWALDLDDFKNRCGCERYPILKTINRVLRPKLHSDPDPGCNKLGPDAPSIPQPPTQPPTVTEATTRPTPVSIVPTKPAPSVPSSSEPPFTIPAGPVDSSVGSEGAPCNFGEFRRHPTDCSKFFECYKGKQREIQCAKGLYWDGKRMCTMKQYAICDGSMTTNAPMPTKRTTTSTTSTTTTSTTTTTTRTTTRSTTTTTSTRRPSWTTPQSTTAKETDPAVDNIEGSPCSTDDFVRHPTDCAAFYECFHGTRRIKYCFKGLYIDIQQKRCDWEHNVDCTSSGSSTSQPTTESTTSWTTPSAVSTPAIQPVKPVKPIHPDPSKSQFKVVCYFTNWAWYRPGNGKFLPDNIDPDLCSHIIYGFAVLNPNSLTIKPHDTWADFDNKFYQRVTAFKAKGIKVLVAIGGWNDSLGNKYSRLVHNPAARSKFIAHVVEFMTKHNFDGLDLDWEYPVCWQVECNKGPKTDKEMFSAWIRELHNELMPRGLLLTAAVSPSYKVIDLGYDVPELNRYLDFINVMTYDYHGHWDKATGHVAPLTDYPESPNPNFNAEFTMKYYVYKGADPKKLIMGMPLYGQAFTLSKAQNNGLNARTEPPHKGSPGRFTRAAGFLSYYEICEKIQKEQYTVVRHTTNAIGPYAYKGRQWVGFDDVDQIRRKSEFVKSNGYGGGMVWALDLDDFANECGCEAFPLLRTINRVLRSYPQTTRSCRLG